jgi:hypothetical protein
VWASCIATLCFTVKQIKRGLILVLPSIATIKSDIIEQMIL